MQPLNHWEDGNPVPVSSSSRGAGRTGLAPVASPPADGLFMAPAPLVQKSLSMYAPAGFNPDTGEVSTRRTRAGQAREGLEKSGVFKNAVREPLAPISITGAKTSTLETVADTSAFIDYVGVTFHGANALDCALSTFGPGLDWVKMEHGGYKYTNCFRRGEISVYHGGEYNHAGEKRQHDTVFVVAAGKGCRQLEGEGIVTAFGSLDDEGVNPWRVLLKTLLMYGCTFPRLDVAIDDREGLLNLDTIEAALDAGDCCTRARKYLPHRPKSTADGKKLGDAITIGSRNSMMFVRIYNKHLEQIVRGEIAEDAPETHWLRCELESHNEKATKLALAIVQYGMQAVSAALWAVIDFKDPDDFEADKKNRWRRKTVGWWERFIEVSAKLRLALSPKLRTVEKVVKWLNTAVAPSLALIDCLPNADELWNALIQSGGERLRGPHFAMLRLHAAGGFV